MADAISVTRAGHRTFFKWHRGRRRGTDPVFTGRRIIEGMNVHAVPRLILVSTAGVLPYKPGVLRGEFFVEPGFEHVFADHKGAWELVEKSGVDYTLACVPKLSNGMRLRSYRREINGLPEGGREISPEDVADFVVDALAGEEYRRARVGIAY